MKSSKLIAHTKCQIADTLKLPKDLSRGEALISVTGQTEAFVENYRGILECNESEILIATQNNRVRFVGNNLKIKYYTEEEMKIQGCILQILFL